MGQNIECPNSAFEIASLFKILSQNPDNAPNYSFTHKNHNFLAFGRSLKLKMVSFVLSRLNEVSTNCELSTLPNFPRPYRTYQIIKLSTLDIMLYSNV